MDHHQHIDFNKLSPDQLTDFITTKNHVNTRQSLTYVSQCLSRLCENTDETSSQLTQLRDKFNEFVAFLEQHMRKEENIFFPYIKKMIALKQSGGLDEIKKISLVESPLRTLESEHRQLTSILKEIREISNNYSVDLGGSSAEYQLCMAELNDFEESLDRHVYFENNILFPKIIELEKELRLCGKIN
jgi:regulator of cell morphogenesis and NO signaling